MSLYWPAGETPSLDPEERASTHCFVSSGGDGEPSMVGPEPRAATLPTDAGVLPRRSLERMNSEQAFGSFMQDNRISNTPENRAPAANNLVPNESRIRLRINMQDSNTRAVPVRQLERMDSEQALSCFMLDSRNGTADCMSTHLLQDLLDLVVPLHLMRTIIILNQFPLQRCRKVRCRATKLKRNLGRLVPHLQPDCPAHCAVCSRFTWACPLCSAPLAHLLMFSPSMKLVDP